MLPIATKWRKRLVATIRSYKHWKAVVCNHMPVDLCIVIGSIFAVYIIYAISNLAFRIIFPGTHYRDARAVLRPSHA